MYFTHFVSAVLFIVPTLISAQSAPASCSRDYGDSFVKASDGKYDCVCGQGRERVDGDRYSCQFSQRSGVFAIFPSFSALFPTASTATKDACDSEAECRSQCLLDGNCQAYTYSDTEGSCTKGSQILPDKSTYRNPFNQASYRGRTTGISGINCDDAVCVEHCISEPYQAHTGCCSSDSGRLHPSHKNSCISGATFATLDKSELRGRIIQSDQGTVSTAANCQDICITTQDCIGAHFDSSAPSASCTLFSQIQRVVPAKSSKAFISGGCAYARSAGLTSDKAVCSDEQRLIPVDPSYQTPAGLISTSSSVSSSSTPAYTGPPPATVTNMSSRSAIGPQSTSQSSASGPGPATVTSGGRPGIHRRSQALRIPMH